MRLLLRSDGRISNSDWFVNSFIMVAYKKIFWSFLGHQLLTEVKKKYSHYKTIYKQVRFGHLPAGWFGHIRSGQGVPSAKQSWTRKSSCVNARGIPTAAYQILHLFPQVGYPLARSDRGYLRWGVPCCEIPCLNHTFRQLLVYCKRSNLVFRH